MERHYVILVHGTYNPPNPHSPTWHQLNEADPENFCSRLNGMFAERGFGRPIGRTLEGEVIQFAWSGENTHVARVEAGQRLAELILDIESKDPDARVHLIAHSHGGNVVLAAVDKYLALIDARAKEVMEAMALHRPEDAEGLAGVAKVALIGVGSDAFVETRLQSEPMQRLLAHFKDTPVTKKTIDDYAATFTRHWKSDRSTNRIGRTIFMGTPFLWKYWAKEPDGWSVRKGLRSIVNAIYAGALSSGVYYLVLLVLWLPFWALANGVRWAVGNFSPGGVPIADYPSLASLAALGIVCAVYGLVAGTMMARDEGKPYAKSIWEQFFGLFIILGGAAFVARWNAPESIWFAPATSYAPIVNPLEWPLWLQVTGGLIVAFAAHSIFGSLDTKRDINVYFDSDSHKLNPKSLGAQSALPYQSMVIHAGHLDEALLALSSEPLVFGLLAPQVRAMLAPPRRIELRRPQFGRGFSPSDWLVQATVAFRQALAMMLGRLVGPIRRAWERRLTEELLHIVASPAMGIDEKEFAGGLITTRTSIGVPHVFTEQVLNVTDELINRPASKAITEQGPRERYKFLWDDQERLERAASSQLWAKVSANRADLDRRYGAFPQLRRDELEQQLMLTCLMIEERVREVMGVTTLMHSGYYSNEVVLQLIVQFIAFSREGAVFDTDAVTVAESEPLAWPEVIGRTPAVTNAA